MPGPPESRLDHVLQFNMILAATHYTRHITRGEDVLYSAEELSDYVGSQTFTPCYTVFGLMCSTGFLVASASMTNSSTLFT